MIRALSRPLIAAAVLALAPLSAAWAAGAAHPNFNGYWDLARAPVVDPVLEPKIAPNTVILQDTGPPEYPAGVYGGLKLKPAAAAVAKAWKPTDDMTLSKACAPPSIVYAMQGPFPIEIFQGTEFIIIKLEYFDMVRIVFMDGRGHLPKDAPHTKVGDSIGHWEGDILVVDTDHLEAATITNNGLYHSDNVHVIERYRLSADGKSLLSTQEFEDPDTLDNRGARWITWVRKPGEYIYPYECDPSFSTNYRK
jgi:hypothetical protein